MRVRFYDASNNFQISRLYVCGWKQNEDHMKRVSSDHLTQYMDFSIKFYVIGTHSNFLADSDWYTKQDFMEEAIAMGIHKI